MFVCLIAHQLLGETTIRTEHVPQVAQHLEVFKLTGTIKPECVFLHVLTLNMVLF